MHPPLLNGVKGGLGRARGALLLLLLLMFGGALSHAQQTQDSQMTDRWFHQRGLMVETQIKARGIKDSRVLAAMKKVERHKFVPAPYAPKAYSDSALPIGNGQTISQPYIVAYMTEVAQLQPGDRVLEIGTGSGYQAAVLAELVKEVYSIEIIPELADRARSTLHALGYSNIRIKSGDGYKGWPEHRHFDAIIVTAAPPSIPEALVDQLGLNGRMILPVGEFYQELVLIKKTDQGIQKERLLPVRFVPMVSQDGSGNIPG